MRAPADGKTISLPTPTPSLSFSFVVLFLWAYFNEKFGG